MRRRNSMALRRIDPRLDNLPLVWEGFSWRRWGGARGGAAGVARRGVVMGLVRGTRSGPTQVLDKQKRGEGGVAAPFVSNSRDRMKTTKQMQHEQRNEQVVPIRQHTGVSSTNQRIETVSPASQQEYPAPDNGHSYQREYDAAHPPISPKHPKAGVESLIISLYL